MQRFPSIEFTTFLQEAKRMLIQSGQWDENDTGIVTQDKIKKSFKLARPSTKKKPKRLIGTGGKVEYVPYDLRYRPLATETTSES